MEAQQQHQRRDHLADQHAIGHERRQAVGDHHFPDRPQSVAQLEMPCSRDQQASAIRNASSAQVVHRRLLQPPSPRSPRIIAARPPTDRTIRADLGHAIRSNTAAAPGCRMIGDLISCEHWPSRHRRDGTPARPRRRHFLRTEFLCRTTSPGMMSRRAADHFIGIPRMRSFWPAAPARARGRCRRRRRYGSVRRPSGCR